MVLSSFPETVWPWRKTIVSQIADQLHEVPRQRGYQGEVEKKGAMHPHQSLGKWTLGTQRKTLSAWPVASSHFLCMWHVNVLKEKKCKKILIFIKCRALAAVAQLIGASSGNQKVMSSIPGQGT